MIKKSKNIIRLTLVIVILLLLNFIFQKYVNSELLNEYTQNFIKISNKNYFLSVFLFIILNILMKVLAIPVAAFLNILAGFLYGTWFGVIYNNIASIIGSSLIFLLFRNLLKPFAQEKYKSKLIKFNENIKLHGPYYLFCIILIGTIPAFVVNVLTSLTDMRFRTFVLVLFFGIIPGSLIYSYAGSKLININLVNVTLSFKILILLGVVKLIGFISLFIRLKFMKYY